MNSNENLNDNSNQETKKRIPIRLIISVVAFSILVVGIIVINNKNNKKSTSDEQSPVEELTSTVSVEPPSPTADPFSETDKKQYLDFISDYNRVVRDYNEDIHGYNSLVSQFSEYTFLDLPDLYPEEKPIAETFNPDLFLGMSELKTKMQSIEEKGRHAVSNYPLLCVSLYNCAVDEYNQLVEEYNLLADRGVISYLRDLPQKAEVKERISELDEDMQRGLFFFKYAFDRQLKENEELATHCVMVQQILNPSEEWVINRLKNIEEITGFQAVTPNNDLNQLLGKTGGYTCCVYFSDANIEQSTVRGSDIVTKGTDCGGAIEVYENREYALNRCEYLSQFDGTLLYSGSYTVIGTIVIRTSYKLNSQGQVKLTNSIAEAFTHIDNSTTQDTDTKQG
ncbi:MAG: hypothetical protein IJM57_07795 [Lachnospiraceae bacterium]|nr:hypothetical protein [Lachnospiraceae bacterium]